jgi:ribosomal protein L15E
METTSELKQLLKALRLSSLLTTLPERVAYAKGNKLTHLEFMEMLFSDEVERRNQGALTRRLLAARVDHDQVLAPPQHVRAVVVRGRVRRAGRGPRAQRPG